MKTRIAIVGDFDPGYKPHLAANDVISHGTAAPGIRSEGTWIATSDLSNAGGLQQIRSCQGILVAPGSHYKSMTGALSAIRLARETRIPLLATCGGFQHLILEYARNVLGFEDAQHAEYDPYASRVSRTEPSAKFRHLTATHE